jgi:hypothetical protein
MLSHKVRGVGIVKTVVIDLEGIIEEEVGYEIDRRVLA